MKMVTTIKDGQQVQRMLGIAGDLVEVDDFIKVSGRSDPFSNGLTICLAGWPRAVVARSGKGHDGRADDLDVMRVGARDHLFVCPDNPPNQGSVLSRRNLAFPREQTDVVDSFKDDHVAHPGLANYIIVETGQRIRSQTIGEQVVSSDPVVENGDVVGRRRFLEPLCQSVGPPVIAVGRGAVSIGNRIPKDDDCPGIGRSRYVNSGDEVPVFNGLRAEELGHRNQVSMCDVGSRSRTWMAGLFVRSRADVQRDGYIGERIYRKRDRIRKVVGVRWNRNAWQAREREGFVAVRHNLFGTRRDWSRDVRSHHEQRRSAKSIRKPQADSSTAEGQMHDLAQGSISEVFWS